MKRYWKVLGVAALAGCGGGDAGDAETVRDRAAVPSAAAASAGVAVYGQPEARLTSDELERGRMDASWRRVVRFDSIAGEDTIRNPESWDSISAQSLNRGATHLPLHGDVAGPSVMRVQVLLDRALFSPGIIDGRWGKNTEKAIYWFQKREGLPATGRVDRSTFERLREVAGNPQQIARAHRLTAEEVDGPFVEIPEDIYDKADLECMCYESLSEKLAEMFHTSPELLARLNPGKDLDALAAGTQLQVPNVRGEDAASGTSPERLVISDGGFYVHAVDADGRILYHFPTTLGSDYAPSPSGEFSITNIAWDPEWHYQPDLLTGVPDGQPDAMIPAGPNNAVGVVWMQLSKPHYGIHGTSAPETIGYTTSHGCVRLTNWDARFLGNQVDPGIEVRFTDVDNQDSRPNARGVG